MSTAAPTMQQVLNILFERASERLRVSLPGQVTRYDSAKQLVDVQPLLADSLEEEDGSLKKQVLPLLVSVPVCFPSAGGFSITLPIQVGDTGLMVFADRSIGEWLEYGGQQTPADLRRHHLTDAVFYPGLRSKVDAIPDADSSVIAIGKDGEATDFAATAQRVLTELNKIRTAFNAHTHGSGTMVAGATPVTGLMSAPSAMAVMVSPASASVKIKG